MAYAAASRRARRSGAADGPAALPDAPAPVAIAGVEHGPIGLPPAPHIYGTSGDDLLTGTAAAEAIDSDWGDDIVDGGGGDDVITDLGGSNSIDAGTGNDIVRLSNVSLGSVHAGVLRTNVVDAGDGNDEVHVAISSYHDLTVDLGAGDDLLTFTGRYTVFATDFRVTTGAGSDRIVFEFGYGDALRSGSEAPPVVIADFAAGAGGDVLDIIGLIEGLLYFTTVAVNPFFSGHLRLVQDGADTIVRIDLDGNGPADGGYYRRDVVRLTNVDADTLTAYNLAGYDPGSAAPLHTIVAGTAAGEWLYASAGGSDLAGLGGDDRLTGSAAADLIEGGAGDDAIEGGHGDDILRGGDGDDVLTDGFGNDIFEGGAGNDTIAIVRPTLQPGAAPVFEEVVINGGDGDDFVSFEVARDEYDYPNRRSVALTIDLGAGNDRILLPYLPVPAAQLTLGAGQDRVVFGQAYLFERDYGDTGNLAPLVIADFAAGNGGDILEFDRTIIGSTGWNGVTNPFTNGYVHLEQFGADTLLVWDYDGNGGSATSYTIVRLANVSAAGLTAFNFGGYAPNGAASSFTIMSGTPGDDILYGSSAAETIDGGAGNDRIEERKGGGDTISGGDGDDVIIVAPLNYTMPVETVSINAGAGNDIVDFSNGRGVANLNLGSGDDRLLLRSAVDGGTFITLGTGADFLVIDGGLASSTIGPITVADFATGAGGDRLDWNFFAEGKLTLIRYLNDPFFDVADYNPFLTEDARLVQSGANTLLQINLAAGTPSANYVTLITFQNASAASFTAYNLGYAPYFPTQTGTAGNDVLTGTAGADIISALAGNDTIDGLAGDDLLRGHEGTDSLTGGAGLDRLEGGFGDDSLSGGGDADLLDGGPGHDTIDGGAGDDLIQDGSGEDIILGGAGDDTIYVAGAADPPGSTDAGDGNDSVYLDRPDAAYSVNLGAGDDHIHTNTLASLLLGPGRDTVHYQPFNRGDGTLVLTDFTPGDSGDIFDLLSCLEGPMRFSSGQYLIALGKDPFALGYAELRQDGNDVVLFLYPDGTNDDAIYGVPPVARFVGATLAQLTPANFGGFDPHAVPNRATVIESDLTIAAGQSVDAVNVAPFQVFLLEFHSGHFLFRNHFGQVDFVNHGTVTSQLTELGYGTLTGIVVEYGGSTGGSFVNAADGSFIVEGTFLDPSGTIAYGRVYGFYAAGQSVLFQNDGYFEVSTLSGRATGVLGGYDAFNVNPTINNGTFIVTSAYEAYGFELGQNTDFINHGTVTVSAGEFAIGVYLREYRDGQFFNDGTITVTTDPGSPYASIGVLAEHGFGPFNSVNAGTVTADIAFYFGDGDFPTYDNADYLLNSGVIHGDVVMGNGADRLTNSGSIFGHVDLGLGLDTYDGSSGTLIGVVDGGEGDDLLLGGGAGETLIGGTGADRIYGGAGDDLLIGGRDSDALDGSAGFDVISYEGSWSAVSVDFALGQAVGEGIDAFRGVEGVIGSAYADTLTGAGAADYLEGAGGNDIISGGGGADLILGDTGDDRMTGGAGADIFAVSVGDGVDIVTDFNPLEDQLEAHGFTATLQIQQIGADTLVTLSAAQSVLLEGVQASSLNSGQLVFDPLPLGPAPAIVPVVLDTQIARDGFFLHAGETARIVDPPAIFPQGDFLIRQTGVDSYVDGGSSSAIVGGHLILEVTASGGMAEGFFLPFEVTLLATGRIDVLTSGAVTAVGILGGSLLSSGYLSVVSANTAAPNLDGYDLSFTRPEVAASSAVGLFCDRVDSIFINNGTIEVSSGLISSGVLSYNNNADGGFWNGGDILVTGGLASIGVLFQGQGHPASAERPTFVNSGDIVVTDATPTPDSVGLALSFVVAGSPGGGLPANIWNSGLIEADYAIRWHKVITPDTGGAANIYNSGELRGMVDLSEGAESLYNRGLITGAIQLRGGNDLFDGRGGTQAAGVSGGFGNDTLLGGSGVDLIDGAADNDIIAGGGGADLLTGGAGNDIFHFEAGFGADTITDFIAGPGEDVIRVAGYGGYQSVQQQGADTLVTFSATDTILLRNVVAANLTAADFAFSAAPLASANIPAAPAQPVPTDFAFPFTPPPAFAVPPPLTLTGTPGADTLLGGDANDMLAGAGGDDLLDGGAGNDVVQGDEGADDLYGGGGADRFVYRAASDSTAALQDWIYDFESGTDKIDLRAVAISGFGWTQQSDANGTYQLLTVDTLAGAMSIRVYGQLAEADLLIGARYFAGTPGDDGLTGGTTNDILLGYAGNDVLFGNDGDDSLIGGDDNDYMNGGAGADYAEGGAGNDAAEGEAGNDILFGGDGNDNLLGKADNDYLNGGPGADFLDGGTGNDAADGGAGNDNMAGGDGNDNLLGGDDSDYINGGIGADFADGGNGNDAVDGGAGNDNMYGGAGNDNLIGNDGDDYLNAGAGLDYIEGGLGKDVAEGGADFDILFGLDGDDILLGNEGDDYVYGGEANDILLGGDGLDYVNGGAGADYAEGGIGNDAIEGEAGNDIIHGNDGNDNLIGGGDQDYLNGGNGADFIDAGTGNDAAEGGAGDDIMFGGDGNDNLLGGADNDYLNGGIGADFLDGGTGNDTAEAGAGNDNMAGGDGIDTLLGGGGDDYADGGAGDDTLFGNLGNDTLFGGSGADRFMFDTALGATNIDTVIGFAAGTDKIHLDDAIFAAAGAPGALAAGAFVVGTTAQDSSDRIIYDSATGNLFYDSDGAGGAAAIRFATLQGAPAITAADFIVY